MDRHKHCAKPVNCTAMYRACCAYGAACSSVRTRPRTEVAPAEPPSSRPCTAAANVRTRSVCVITPTRRPSALHNGNMVVPALGKTEGRDPWRAAPHVGHLDRVRHDFAHILGLAAVRPMTSVRKRCPKPSCISRLASRMKSATVTIPTTRALSIYHGQRLDLLGAHQRPGVFQGETPASTANGGLDMMSEQRTSPSVRWKAARPAKCNKPLQIGTAHVQHLVVVRQRCIHIRGGKSALSNIGSGRHPLRMGVPAPCQAVVDHGRVTKQYDHIEQDGKCGQVPPVPRGQHDIQRHRSARWMQATQGHHQRNSQPHRNRPCPVHGIRE